MHKWDPELALQLIERERITGTGGVPTIAWQLLDHPALREVRSLLARKHRLWRRAGGRRAGAPAEGEISEVGARHRLGDDRDHSVPSPGIGRRLRTAAGKQRSRACRSCEMKIVDPDGNEIAAGGIGELWVKGPNVVNGYWNKPEATAETFVDGWLRTGDIARIDEEGFCFILDRAKDMLIRGGENIYCVEVENALYEHPGGDRRRRRRHPAPHAGRGAGRGRHAQARRAGERSRIARHSSPSASRRSRCRSGSCSRRRCCRAMRTARSSSPSSSACLHHRRAMPGTRPGTTRDAPLVRITP